MPGPRWYRSRHRRALEEILGSPGLLDGPAVTRGGARLVEGLRDWLEICAGSALASFVTLPSEAVAAAWADAAATAGYTALSRRAFGEVLLPLPLASRPPRFRDQGLLRTWAAACRHQGIDPRRPDRLPRLFGVDAGVGWEGGMRWEVTGGDPPVRLEAGPEPSVVCAWPESPAVEALLPPRGRTGIPP